ncbi:hypothetical protein IC582_012436 [Cucumis melo]|uniref:Uncharacterized protein At1g28695-like isoform X1 n=2 Tax=Cucumis melo TaxID=3656 RepID=A0A1S3AWQ7_CUCME|nr:uncharacterized protein At1g28695-like isoform X1 [Cucumis melo]KAA0049125.1 Nucleotide-diphospho-sugar transferase [Cucumis melo var. makuwa]
MDFPPKKPPLVTYAFLLLFFIASFLLILAPSSSLNPLLFFPSTFQCNRLNSVESLHYSSGDELDFALEKAAMANKTVVIAVINKAYADQGVRDDTTMLDVFLSSFWLGEDTRKLLDHLLLVAVDQTAYDRCRFQRLNCFKLETEGVDFGGEKLYMSEEFIKMMWKRTLFLLEVLKRGYSFIFTDTDVMWLRDPFSKLSKDETEDLQISTDHFNGNPWSQSNPINTGFYFVRSNNRTIALFDKWYSMKNITAGQKEQDVLFHLIRGGIFRQLNLKVRFLNTLFFSGFCQKSSDFHQVSTVHANCCRTIVAKINDLRATLGDWKRFRKSTNASEIFWWTDHVGCKRSWKH